MNYTITTKITTIPVSRIDEFRDVDRFIEYCKVCPNYNNRYSCPPHDIDDEEFLRRYSHAHFILTQIIYDDETKSECTGNKELQNKVLGESRTKVMKAVEDEILKKEIKGGVAVGSSGCHICGECKKRTGQPCANPDRMRYAIDSFGFDITKIMNDLFDTDLSWPKETIPDYQCLVSMFLDDDDDFFLD